MPSTGASNPFTDDDDEDDDDNGGHTGRSSQPLSSRTPARLPEASRIRSSFAALAVAVLIVVAATAVLTQADVPIAPASVAGSPASSSDETIVSFDGTPLAITVYKPAGASAADPVPVILHSHGWGGSRIKDGSGLAGILWNASFGVVTIDARGHGESGGLAKVHHEDYEVRDWQVILDWIHDELDWVQKEPGSGIPKDIVAGGAGYSYAGGIQMQVASHDARLDALAPEITWTDLPYALAPANVPKSVWIDILIGFALQGGVRYDPAIDAWYQQILLTGEVPEDAIEHFRHATPDLSQIRADVLLIQGMPDVLFNANNAIRGYETLEAHAAGDIRLFTHLTGHVLPSLQPFGTTDQRAETFKDDGPCGTNSEIILAWMDQHLRGGPESGVPEVSFALDNGECADFDALPSSSVDVPLAALPVATAGSSLVPLMEGPALLAGIPHLSADALAATGTVFFASLVILSPDGHERIVDDQTQPVRVVPGEPVDTDLVAVAAQLEEGDRLFLRVDGVNEWFVHNSQRVQSAAVLTNVVVTLPVVS